MSLGYSYVKWNHYAHLSISVSPSIYPTLMSGPNCLRTQT